MSVKDEVKKRLMQAMREKNQIEVTALRQIKTEIMKVETSGAAKEISEEDFIKLLNSLAKQHQESIEVYKANNRTEQLEQEEKELEVIKSFLPAEIEDAKLEEIVKAAIESTGATSKKDMGGVMKKVKEDIDALGLMADGKKLADCVKGNLG